MALFFPTRRGSGGGKPKAARGGPCSDAILAPLFQTIRESRESTMGEERHIVIVGGGIIGASIGYYLTRHASRPAVTLLEASKDVAPGASGKAGGFLALDWHPMPTSSLGSLSFRLHKELAEKDNGAELWGYRQVETHQLSLDTSRKPRTRPSLDWLNPDVFISSGPIGGGGTTAQVTPGLLCLLYTSPSPRDRG